MKTAKRKASCPFSEKIFTSKPVNRVVMRPKHTTDNRESLFCAIVCNGSLRPDGGSEFNAG